ncbi:hypothetical protein HS5_00520 [Acidianus sp. HS-5]|nr:hypothetical protein HS5_00520 [Acidianus sp. HS-5]
MIPVNPTAKEILGRKSYSSILEIPDKIEVVEVFRPSSEVPKIIEEVIKRKKERSDVKVLWLQEGMRKQLNWQKRRILVRYKIDACIKSIISLCKISERKIDKVFNMFIQKINYGRRS